MSLNLSLFYACIYWLNFCRSSTHSSWGHVELLSQSDVIILRRGSAHLHVISQYACLPTGDPNFDPPSVNPKPLHRSTRYVAQLNMSDISRNTLRIFEIGLRWRSHKKYVISRLSDSHPVKPVDAQTCIMVWTMRFHSIIAFWIRVEKKICFSCEKKQKLKKFAPKKELRVEQKCWIISSVS